MTVRLTQKQEMFCLEVFKGNSASDAYRVVYNCKNMKPESINRKAKELMDNGKITARLKVLRTALIKKANIDAEYVLETIVDTIERCRQARPVFDKKGNPVFIETPCGDIAAAYVFEPTAVLKGADMLAKHLGLYETDNHQKNNGVVMNTIQSLPLDVQIKLAEQLRGIANQRPNQKNLN